MAGELPGLDVIQQWAARLGIDIAETVQKAQMLMQTDPAALRGHATNVSTVATGLATGQQDMHRTGSDVLANSSGQYAQAFAPYHTDLVNHVGETANGANNLATHLNNVAGVFENSQNTVVSATGVTATALGMLQA